MKGYSFIGKLRPEHSEIMKIKMKGVNRGDNFREIKRKQNYLRLVSSKLKIV